MAIILSKGQKIDLTKTNPGLVRGVIGLGWDTNKYQVARSLILMHLHFLWM